MEITIIGLVQVLIGMTLLVLGGLRSLFVLLLVSGLLGGSAAIQLPALGGSSIPPVQLALLFIYVRLLVPGGGYFGALPESIANNFWLVIFTLFGVVSAFILPRLFAGSIDVFPMEPLVGQGMFDTVPLVPTSQNITSAFYLLGSLLAAIAAFVVCRYADGTRALVSAGIAIGWAHAIIGLLAVFARGTSIEFIFEFFRNANYVQMDDALGSFVRIRGIFAETSAYTAFAFSFFVLNAELWYRSIRSRATGTTAIVLSVVLFFSTSSSAYFGLAAYLFFVLLRLLLFPFAGAGHKAVRLCQFAGLLLLVVAILLAIVPGLPQAIYDMVVQMTVEKSDSISGRQRMFLASQGWRLFLDSHGLGIGPGSFRSSSMATAMLGSVGILGTVSFLLYLNNVLSPGRRSTFMVTDDLGADVGAALGSAAVLSLIPAMILAPDIQPGINFSVFAGAALALRPRISGAAAERGKESGSLAPALQFKPAPVDGP